jgi:hypothetical protein
VPSGQYSVAAVIGGNVWKQNWSAPALQQKGKAALGGLFVIIFPSFRRLGLFSKIRPGNSAAPTSRS